jgi:hypothetical protein
MKLFYYLSILILLFIFSFTFKGNPKTGLGKTTTNDAYDYINVNSISMWVSNTGDGSYNPITQGAGFEWPIGSGKTAVYEDGFIWAGLNRSLPDSIQIQAGGSKYSRGLQAGKILDNGLADDPNNPRYRVYKIKKDWQSLSPGPKRDAYQKDYEEWPVEDGAPWIDVNGDGLFTRGIDTPDIIGDEMLWSVANDLDSSRTKRLFNSAPLGIEQQTTVWGFASNNDLTNTVYKKIRLINKGSNIIDSMYISIWSDPDLGDGRDDYIGCDTTLDLGFSFNTSRDKIYGNIPPVVGYTLIKAPKLATNKKMTSFLLSWPSPLIIEPEPQPLVQYNFSKGLAADGDPLINPEGDTIKYMVPGDPISQTGWFEGESESAWGNPPGDRRFYINSGPFTFAPGDTQEIVYAIMIGQGENNIDGIRVVRDLAVYAQSYFDKGFKEKIPSSPTIKALPQDKRIKLFWDKSTESYTENDPILQYRNEEDSAWLFEGYRLWQYTDIDGSEPVLLTIFDLDNNISKIRSYNFINGENSPVILFISPDNGLQHSLIIDKDSYTEKELSNGSHYFFGITSFVYSEKSSTPFKESKPSIVEVIPGQNRIDYNPAYANDDRIEVKHSQGFGDGDIIVQIKNPSLVKVDTFTLFLDSTLADVSASITNDLGELLTSNTNYKDIINIFSDSLLYDLGFTVEIKNTGLDSLDGRSSRIKSVLETSGPGGVKLNNPVNIIKGLNSTNKWEVVSPGIYQANLFDPRNTLNWVAGIDHGREKYEIRFTERGSEYYLTGYATGFSKSAPFKDDPKAADRIPFEIWTLGEDLLNTEDDKQLIIKILDKNVADSTEAISDSTWSHFPADDPFHPDEWEQIFAYYPVDSVYQEPLPERSGYSNKPRGLHKFGRFTIKGALPEEGTIIQIDTWRPLTKDDVFTFATSAPDTADILGAKKKLDQISVFPNPYFGVDPFGRFPNQNFVRFTSLPQNVIVRIFTISGQLVQKIEKDNASPWLDWDLRNLDGKAVASGIYIVHLDMPHIGNKIMKLAVVQDNR